MKPPALWWETSTPWTLSGIPWQDVLPPARPQGLWVAQTPILTLVLPGTSHIVRHPAYRAEEGSQVSTGHLEAHEVLQVGTSRQWPLGRPGL